MFRTVFERLKARADSPFFREMGRRGPAKRYLIATTARTGSTLLCSRIAEYSDLGFPNEFLNESYVSEFERLFPNPSLKDFERYVADVFSSRNGGVFGLKTDWWRFRLAREAGLLSTFYEPLDLVVWLKREDFVAQAVSLALAEATQVWHVRDQDDDGRMEGRQAEAAFDARRIIGHARNIFNQEYYWRQFFEGCDAPRVDLTYEGLEQNVDGGVQAIADAFDLSLIRRRSEPIVRKATSGLAQAWRVRFEDECADFIAFWREHRGLITASG